jgi:hypothetical protein
MKMDIDGKHVGTGHSVNAGKIKLLEKRIIFLI